MFRSCFHALDASQIAARNKVKLEEEKAKAVERMKDDGEKAERANALAPLLVGGIALGGFAAVFPLFYKNLMRLGLRFASVVNKNIDESEYNKGR